MKTHYDVLNLDRNCSAKDIKDSFIKLSKKYHPDKNKSSDAHKKFVEVNEAYSVLGKPSSRHLYDQTLLHEAPRTMHTTGANRRYQTYKTPYEYYTEMYANNIRRHQEMNQAYFTPTKLKVLCFCVLLMVFGSGLQIIAESRRRAFRSHQIASMVKEARDRRLRKRQEALEQEAQMFKNEKDSLNPGESSF